MFGWALIFLIVAIVAGLFGFGGVAAISIDFAQILFVIAIVLFIVTAVAGLFHRRR
jgi:uncharacterized membrane protein YtjA (UPF0391 family)